MFPVKTKDAFETMDVDQVLRGQPGSMMSGSRRTKYGIPRASATDNSLIVPVELRAAASINPKTPSDSDNSDKSVIEID